MSGVDKTREESRNCRKDSDAEREISGTAFAARHVHRSSGDGSAHGADEESGDRTGSGPADRLQHGSPNLPPTMRAQNFTIVRDNSRVPISRQQISADLQKRAQRLEEICDADVQYEVAWDTFGDDQQALENIDRVSGYAVQRAVQTICNDATRKPAVRSGLHRVRLINVKEPSAENVTLRDGVLEIRSAYAEGRTAATGHDAVRLAVENGLSAGQSEASARFEKSMDIGLEEWREGIGYDLDALARMTSAERARIERRLIRNLAERGDWRDIDALASIGTPTAIDEVMKARRHGDPAVCEHALSYFLARGPVDRELENDVIRAIGLGAIDLAEECPTPPVKQALLELSLSGEATIRVNAAALLLYLCGGAAEPFDWSQRPFFLRFGEDDPGEVRAAWEELRRRSGL